MRIHSLQHVPFEGLATIEDWAISRGYTISRTLLFRGEPLPDPAEFNWLVVMGGPMNVYEEERYPWLAQEKDLIRRAIDEGKVVLGICLGAQLIADVLGGKVLKNKEREIGWHPVSLTPEAKRSETFGVLPEKFVALHWHGDTFEIPPGAIHTAKSEACENQAFQLGRAIGLQFHLEATAEGIENLIRNCSEELAGGGRFVQDAVEILAGFDAISEMNGLMERFLDEAVRLYRE
ncbi:type 1 glutamine amidotransferase [Methanotrichaceae archaeon M04Ac]|jgi:GMP synthase-like glutamine amidotransferase|uniref:Type 1 glutamine amidotransferase n=1 Tax=Candidatus Methanocrinis alkalitolerans TaxID=3033395 RepID=A0ABT5XET4_9EURY|nr:type 1 glutamine amidotransferase [Candidatus Methanocrinis alkalitolerans]MCR3883329.1 type 1 glutamine amidotransferase [Methanothrix sp.]MDF0593229.1 type 1 glutamine amidotransferase [Candidatus Methanocrinis alkalitolerans]